MNARGFYILGGLIIFAATAMDNSIGYISFVMWLAAFALVAAGLSVVFSIICLISSVSFHYMAIDSASLLESVLLPWTFGITFVFISLFLFFKHHTRGGISNDMSNPTGGDLGSSCDADGGGGGGD